MAYSVKKIHIITLLLCACIIRSVFSQNNINALPGLFESDNSFIYQTAEQELDRLVSYYGDSEPISLTSNNARKQAPFLSDLLYSHTQMLASKAGLVAPEVCISCSSDSLLYNAALHTIKHVFTNPLTHKTITRKIEHRLIIDQELLKLFLWKKDNIQLLDATIAHELGHQYFGHGLKKNDSIQDEFEADAFSLSLLEAPDKALTNLNLISLAAATYQYIETCNQLPHWITIKDKCDLTRKITCALIETNPDLGELGKSSTLTLFHTLLHAALDVSLTPYKLITDLNDPVLLFDIYKKIQTISTSPQALIKISMHRLEKKCRKHEAYNNFSASHPAPGLRRQYLLDCIARA